MKKWMFISLLSVFMYLLGMGLGSCDIPTGEKNTVNNDDNKNSNNDSGDDEGNEDNSGDDTGDDDETGDPGPVPLEGKLIILQAYGTGDKYDGAVSRSFVELYNKHDEALSLEGVFVRYSAGGTAWKVLDLTGKTIPGNASFLILGKIMNASSANLHLTIGDDEADMIWMDGAEPITFDNSAFKLLLDNSAEPVNMANPFNTDGQGTKISGYIDMLGANDNDKKEHIDGTETEAPYGLSKQKSLRRLTAADTDNNARDFSDVDWRRRSGDMTEDEANFEALRPRNAGYGSRNPVFVPAGNSSGTGTPPAFAAYSGLPILEIDVAVGTIVTRGTWYTGYNYTLYDKDGNTLSAGLTDVKGRGNSTWSSTTVTPPGSYFGTVVNKKPYSIKFAEKTAVLGMPKHKRWNLLANLFDKSLLRNETGLELGRIFDKMAWTPRSAQVALYFNQQFNGVYLLAEAIKIDNNRVNISELSVDNPNGGYIVEVYGGKTNSGDDNPDLFFETNYVKTMGWSGGTKNGFAISDPDKDLTSALINKIKADVMAAETALYSSNFKDPATGYQKYLDVDSFVDWYLVMELAKNPDANFFASCYMYYNPADQKLYMGPVWDFDIGFGNDNMNNFSSPTGFHVNASSTYPYNTATPTPWITQLFKDPAFVAKVKARWNEKKPVLDTLNAYIDQRAAYLDTAQALNFQQFPNVLSGSFWNTVSPVPGTYAGEVSSLKNFITQRLAWMHTSINALQ
jgi:hypothetical protein